MNDNGTACANCGKLIEHIRGRWTHVDFLPNGEEHHVWCHATKAEPRPGRPLA